LADFLLDGLGGGLRILYVALEKLLISRLVRRSGRYIPIVAFFALPVTLILYSVRRIVLVRFGEIPSRLGHMSADLDTYLALKKEEPNSRTWTLDFFCEPSRDANFNKALVRQFSDLVHIWPRYLVLPFLIVSNEFNFLSVHRLDFTPKGKYEGELNHLVHQTSPQFIVEEDRRTQMSQVLLGKSISINKLIVLALRDSLFTSQALGVNTDYSMYRNFDKLQVNSLIEELVTLGYGVVRAGSKAFELATFYENQFWDYANSNFRSDENDLAIFSLAKVCIGIDTGLHNLALLFRKPLYLISTPSFTNKLTSPLLRLVTYCDFIDSHTNGSIGLAEMRARGVFTATGPEDFSRIGVKPNRMSEQDIRSFVGEIHQFENGLWEESAESKEIRTAFLDYLEPYGFKKDSKFKFPNYWSKKSNWLS